MRIRRTPIARRGDAESGSVAGIVAIIAEEKGTEEIPVCRLVSSSSDLSPAIGPSESIGGGGGGGREEGGC